MKYAVKISETFIAVGGVNVYTKTFLPDRPGERLPAVILSHGYNSASEDLADIAAALAENGFCAVSYDFRGGSLRSKSGGKSADMSISSEVADLKAVIAYVKALEFIDGGKIYLYGESQGGFVSALAADGEIKGLFLLYPAFCIPDDWKRRMEEGLPETFDVMGMELSRKFCEGLPDYDVFEHIGNYAGKTVIFHGGADTLVPLSYAEKAEKSFKNALLTVFDGEGHGFSPKAREKMIKAILNDLM